MNKCSNVVSIKNTYHGATTFTSAKSNLKLDFLGVSTTASNLEPEHLGQIDEDAINFDWVN